MARTNRIVAWVSLSLGAGTGLVMGLWSFAGPVPVPDFLGEYGDVSRRLARLGHIALFGLAILNLLLVREMPALALSARLRRVALAAMNFGNVFLPLVLIAAAFYHPIKYALPLPATCVFVAMVIGAWGVIGSSDDDPSPRH